MKALAVLFLAWMPHQASPGALSGSGPGSAAREPPAGGERGLRARGPAGDELDELRQALRSTQERKRREAVQALAKLGSPEAWELAIGALSDPSPQVADEAQLQLGTLAEPGALAALLGKQGLASRDDLVRERSAEALGRVDLAVGADALVKALSDREPGVRRQTAWSAERLARESRLGGDPADLRDALERALGRDRDSGVRAAALAALGALGQDGVRGRIERGLDSGEPLVRSAAVLLTSDLSPAEALPLLRAAGADPAAEVRRQSVERLAALRTREALAVLVERLEAEPELRLRWRTAELLQRLSGRKHRLDPRPWRAWIAGLPSDWTPAAGTEPEPEVESTASFAGLPILSQRVAFLIDLSGSMWQERDGKTRKERVDDALARALAALGPDVHFNLIPYTSAPIPWQRTLVPATPANVRRATDFFQSRRDQGKGDFWSALQLALSDPSVDTVIALTDGAPTGGERWNLELMKSLFAEQNRFRRVTLDAILAGASKTLQRHWADMCAQTGGRWVTME